MRFRNTNMIPSSIAMLIGIVMFHEINSRAVGAKQGLYEVIVYNASSCVLEQPWFHANVSVHTSRGRSLLRGAGFTKREIKDAKFRIRIYYLGDKTKLKVFEIKNQNCRNTIVQLMLTTAGLRYDANKCFMTPSTWEFGGMDLDHIFHTVVPSVEYGHLHGRWEVYTPTVPLMCVDVYAQLVPRKDTVATT